MARTEKLSDTNLVGDDCKRCPRPAAVVASRQDPRNLGALINEGLCVSCAQEAVQGQTPPRRVREHDRARIEREKADAQRRRDAKAELAKAQVSMGPDWGRR